MGRRERGRTTRQQDNEYRCDVRRSAGSVLRTKERDELMA